MQPSNYKWECKLGRRLRLKWRSLAIFLAFVLLLAGFLAFVTCRREKLYTVTVLPSLGGGVTRPLAINDKGQIIAVAEIVGGRYHLFLWDPHHGMQDLGAARETDSFDLNSAGQIAGTTEDPNGNRQAFLWDPKDGKQMLGTLGGAESVALALNNRGQVIGWSNPAEGPPQAFIWDKSNGMRKLSTLGERGSVANAINDAGQVMGSLETDTIPRQPEPCFWDSTDAATTPSTPLQPPDDYQGGSDINNNGYVLGRGYRWDKDGYWTFLWRKGAELQWLFPLENAAGPLVLNDANQVLYREKRFSSLGWLSKRFFPPRVNCYLWDPKRGRIALDGQVPQEMGRLLMMRDLNNKGCIVGLLRSKDLTRHQCVLLEPIPDQWDEQLVDGIPI